MSYRGALRRAFFHLQFSPMTLIYRRHPRSLELPIVYNYESNNVPKYKRNDYSHLKFRPMFIKFYRLQIPLRNWGDFEFYDKIGGG